MPSDPIRLVSQTLSVVVVLGFVVAGYTATMPRPPALRPDPRLTPGEVAWTDTREGCKAAYVYQHGHATWQMRLGVCARYGLEVDGKRFALDHVIPIELGGAGTNATLWPELTSGTWSADKKERLADRLRALVCAGVVPLQRAQHDIATDWIGAYRRYMR